MFLKIIFFFNFIFFCFCFFYSKAQILECCGLNLVDSQNQVAIEASRTFPRGNYGALVAKVCSDEPVIFQIWTKMDVYNYKLKWNFTFTPSKEDVEKSKVVISFKSPIQIDTLDRIGIFSPGNSGQKLPIPFSTNPSSSLLLSETSFEYPYALPSGSLNLSPHSRPFNFEKSLKFCTDVNNCPELDYKSSQTSFTISDFITLPAKCCDSNILPKCDFTNRTNIILNHQTEVILRLTERIRQLNKLIENYIKGKKEISYCQDFTYEKGSYGLRYCYKVFKERVAMAEAALICSKDQARMVFIQDRNEDNFLSELIREAYPQTSDVEFWTAASIEKRNSSNSWMWYNNLLKGDKFESFGTYTNWKDGSVPVPLNEKDVCAVGHVNRGSYWEKKECNNRQPFICKIRKYCL